MAKVGIVVIGRNEGDRLKDCLESLPVELPTVYVDSGSTDDSVAFAKERGVTVVQLDASKPFTAARGRNAGLRRLVFDIPEIEFVQMIDGDCSLDNDWLPSALAALTRGNGLAAVFGRRRERYPERSVYNRMCDDEWNVPVGVVDSCGGDALFRVQPLLKTGGYRENLIAGEEPDLCLRLRNLGFLIERIESEMTRHDAGILRFHQWWKRVKRGGYAYAEHCWIHRATAFRSWRKQLVSIAIWGGIFPGIFLITLSSLTLALQNLIFPIAVLTIYAIQWARIGFKKKGAVSEISYPIQYAALIMVGKFAEFLGVVKFAIDKLLGDGGALIEYKNVRR